MIEKFVKRNPARFWDWFSRHENEYLHLDEDNYEQAFHKLFNVLHKYNPYLGFEFIPEPKEGKKELVITANGNPHLFDTVYLLVKGAPEKLKDRWSFTALRQPTIDDVIIYYGPHSFSSKDIYYEKEESLVEKGKWDILIYIKGVVYDTVESELYVAEAMSHLLDGVIGEYVNATKISDIVLVDEEDLEEPKTIMNLRKEI